MIPLIHLGMIVQYFIPTIASSDQPLSDIFRDTKKKIKKKPASIPPTLTEHDSLRPDLMNSMRDELRLKNVEDGFEAVELGHPSSRPDINLQGLGLTDTGGLRLLENCYLEQLIFQ